MYPQEKLKSSHSEWSNRFLGLQYWNIKFCSKLCVIIATEPFIKGYSIACYGKDDGVFYKKNMSRTFKTFQVSMEFS